MGEGADAFDCLRCGACCRGDDGWVTVDRTDDARIEANPALASLVRYLRRGGHVRRTLRMVDGACAALARNGDGVRCTIYEARPSVCREVEQGSATCLAARKAHGLDLEIDGKFSIRSMKS